MKVAVVGLMTCSMFAFVLTDEAAGASQKCSISYETFEVAVPHIDMENCPDGDATKGAFCRASVGGDQVHIFYFAENGDQCLLQVKSFEADEFSLTVKSR